MNPELVREFEEMSRALSEENDAKLYEMYTTEPELRIELMMHLPFTWPFDGKQAEEAPYQWPLGWLRLLPLNQTEHVHFYHVVPLYTQERDFETANGMQPLLEAMAKAPNSLVVRPDREPFV